MSRTLILALCLCLAGSAAVRAAVDDADTFCPGADEGMPGGWTMLTEDVPEEVNDFLAGKVSGGFAGASSSADAACRTPALLPESSAWLPLIPAPPPHHETPPHPTPPPPLPSDRGGCDGAGGQRHHLGVLRR